MAFAIKYGDSIKVIAAAAIHTKGRRNGGTLSIVGLFFPGKYTTFIYLIPFRFENAQ